MKFDFTLHLHEVNFKNYRAPLAACGGQNFGQNERSDFITRPLRSDYENIIMLSSSRG